MTEADFWQQITAGDDTAREALADWLEERGDERAAWVRDPDIARHMLPDGRDPVSSLIANLCRSRTAPEAYAASVVLARLGSYAVPAILDRIAKGNNGYIYTVLPLLPREVFVPFTDRILALANAGKSPDAVVDILRPLGMASLPALDALVGALPSRGQTEDDYWVGTGGKAAELLTGFGPAALSAAPGLTRLLLLQDQDHIRWTESGEYRRDDEWRDPAEVALAALGPHAATSVLDEMAAHDSPITHVPISRALARADDGAGRLHPYLSHSCRAVAVTAALALADIDPPAAVPVLVEALVHPGREIWPEAVIMALIRVSPRHPPPLDRLRETASRLSPDDWALLARLDPTLGDETR